MGTCASHNLKGSACGEGTDGTWRNMVSVSATSVL
jgi:hypothetical protein